MSHFEHMTILVSAIVLLMLATTSYLFADIITTTLTRIIDGDTIIVCLAAHPPRACPPACAGLRRVRLADIDAPELKQPHGEAARSFLAALIADKSIRCDSSKTDRYGRLLATLNSRNVIRRALIAPGKTRANAHRQEVGTRKSIQTSHISLDITSTPTGGDQQPGSNVVGILWWKYSSADGFPQHSFSLPSSPSLAHLRRSASSAGNSPSEHPSLPHIK